MKILCVFGRYAYGDVVRGESYEHSNFWPALASQATEIRLFDSFDRTGYRDFADLNRQLLQAVSDFKPDLLFCVLMHYEVWTETLDLIRARSPAAILHWGTDDSWKFTQFSRFIARHVDVHVTTDARALVRAQREGLGNVVKSQWAASGTRLAPPLPSADCSYDVSFVGSAYGNRRQWISGLKKRGIEVACFGHGWDAGVVDAEAIPGIYRHSRISLNFADSGLQLAGLGLQRSRQIKARTFEVPGAGGLLLTEGAPELGDYFRIGEEIDVFDGLDSLAARIRHYLANPTVRDAVAHAGHARAAAEHTYEARFPPLLAAATQAARTRPPGQGLDAALLAHCVFEHEVGPSLSILASLTRRMSTLLLGPKWGPRAVRRAMYEIGWRCAGKRVYGARGWPGRLFYTES